MVIAASMHHSCRRVPHSPIQNTHSSATGAIPDGPRHAQERDDDQVGEYEPRRVLGGSRAHGASATTPAITTVKTPAAISGTSFQSRWEPQSANGNSAAAMDGSTNWLRRISDWALILRFFGTGGSGS